jgi:hypothetical protein
LLREARSNADLLNRAANWILPIGSCGKCVKDFRRTRLYMLHKVRSRRCDGAIVYRKDDEGVRSGLPPQSLGEPPRLRIRFFSLRFDKKCRPIAISDKLIRLLQISVQQRFTSFSCAIRAGKIMETRIPDGADFDARDAYKSASRERDYVIVFFLFFVAYVFLSFILQGNIFDIYNAIRRKRTFCRPCNKFGFMAKTLEMEGAIPTTLVRYFLPLYNGEL